jgi:hypothetical protein
MQSEAVQTNSEAFVALPASFFPSVQCCDHCDREAPDVRERGEPIWGPGERFLCDDCAEAAWER